MLTELQEVLDTVDARPTVGAYSQAARRVQALSGELRPARIALLSSFTIDSLVPYAEVEAARQGFALEVYRGPFNSVRQELLTPGSGCAEHRPEVVFIAQALEDVCPPLAYQFLDLSEAAVADCIQQVVQETVAALEAFRQHSSAALVVHNFALPQTPLLGIYEPLLPHSQTAAIRSLNQQLAAALSTLRGAYVLDFDRLCAEVGYANWRDEKMWHLGRAPLGVKALCGVARVYAQFLRAIVAAPRKCLVLDLDNTLWGGVVGELGVSGIQLGHTYPGSIFRAFQQTALQLHQRGVMLAVNSKNNLADVEEVFRSHPDMLLKREHFAAVRANWQSKPENMLELAQELGIGLDSMVFFDDNPAERAQMRSALPQVLTLEVPVDPMAYAQTLSSCGVFDKLSFTEEDRRRGALYRERSERAQLERTAGSLEEFLTSLGMRAEIGPVDDFAFPRVLDLLHKTNQFNLTTRRYSAAELAALVADPDCGVFWLKLTDRFGDNGIVAVAVIQAGREAAFLDTFLMSCRVIGRGAETALLAFLAEWVQARGLSVLEGEFLPSAKNAPAAGFFEHHGFSARGADGNGSKASYWRLNLQETPVLWPASIQRGDR